MCSKTSQLSVRTLLGSSDRYVIPIYQRNYAWNDVHVRQLIQDVADSAKYKANQKYYIGTLVVSERENGDFEIVDGQQRMTTLHIVMCALKNEMEQTDLNLDWYNHVNISYELRERSVKSLNALFSHTDVQDVTDDVMRNNYFLVKPLVNEIVKESDRKQFYDYLFDNVYITRVVLPSGTNLNHYFEIMNNRGEQLEKHEILKARLLDFVREEEQVSQFMALIWKACSNMERFVQMGFEPNIRKILFGENWSQFQFGNFEDMFESCNNAHIKFVSSASSPFSINDIFGNVLKEDARADASSDGSNEFDSRFNSIVNFPNFLLHVLRVMTKEDIPLDDKRLIDTFESRELSQDFVKRFMFELLRMRFYFDKFVIKRDYIEDRNNGEWKIYSLGKNNNDGIKYDNTFDKKAKDEVENLQLMFHVSLPSQNYKHWLSAILLYISDHNGDGRGLGGYLEKLSKAYMLDNFLADKNGLQKQSYYEMIFENNGLPQNSCPKNLAMPGYSDNIDNFVFNYLDYQLWKGNKDEFHDFEFTFRSSVEHFYPQNPIEGNKDMDDEHLNSFGNLCLISSSKNSKLSNYSPIAKVDHYKHSGIDSIKQKLMMDIAESKNEWKSNNVEDHEADMTNVIKKSL